MRIKLTVAGLAICIASTLTPHLAAHAGPMLEIDDFFRTTGPEYLAPEFAQGGGEQTVNTYSGFVEVIVEGVGNNTVNVPNADLSDAFYNFSQITNDPVGLFDNTLRLGSESQIEPLPRSFGFVPNCALHVECGSLHVADLAVAFEGASFAVDGAFPLDVNSGFAPEYAADHIYRMILDLGSYAGTLTFGYGDGGTFDNSGNYEITLFGVRLHPVPEPSTIALFTIGLAGLGFMVRRPRRKVAA